MQELDLLLTNLPITPPPELVEQWLVKGRHQDYCSSTDYAIAQSAQWGADQELEACLEWLERNYNYPEVGNPLRTARRPSPPSLKEQALEELMSCEVHYTIELLTIRKALEALPND